MQILNLLTDKLLTDLYTIPVIISKNFVLRGFLRSLKRLHNGHNIIHICRVLEQKIFQAIQ